MADLSTPEGKLVERLRGPKQPSHCGNFVEVYDGLLIEAADALSRIAAERDEALDALEAALASPAAQTEDWVLVPREPTEAMLDAAFGLFDRVGVTTKVPAALGFEAWHAMLAAAPSAPQPTEPVAWRCDGCGRLAKDPDADLKGPRDAGHISCCPEREMLPLYLAFPVAQQREDGWFDMSIAPKNGTRIVVQMPDGPGEECWYETPAGWRYAALSPEREDQSNG